MELLEQVLAGVTIVGAIMPRLLGKHVAKIVRGYRDGMNDG